MRRPNPVYSFLAAAALALVVLFTFFVYRDWGPQSVVRRFHIAASRGDRAEIDALSVEGADDAATRFLVRDVMRLAAVGTRYEIVSVKKRGNATLVGVEYRLSNGMSGGTVWYVERPNRTDWRVNCRATLRSFAGR